MPDVKLLIGTRKGLFIATAEADRRNFEWVGPLLPGFEVQSACIDKTDPSIGYALAQHKVWGNHIFRSSDGGRSWHPTSGLPRHEQSESTDSIRMMWSVSSGTNSGELYVSIEPPGLFFSSDFGETWICLEGFHQQPTAPYWHPAKGGLAVHSLTQDPNNPKTIYVALAAGGAYRSDDSGKHWKPINQGLRAPYLKDTHPPAGQCVHRLIAHPSGQGLLYLQTHTGTYVSHNRGDTWDEITLGLPSDFGYALTSPAEDPQSIYVIPEESSQLRAVCNHRLRVYHSKDQGANWLALSAGLPQENAYVTILREGLDNDGLEPLGLYLGTTGGHFFSSTDAGNSWKLLAGYLPGILCVKAYVE